MIFFRGNIVGLCGVGFGVETAEPDTLATDGDSCDPPAGAFFEEDADVFRGSFSRGFGFIALVLRVSCDT